MLRVQYLYRVGKIGLDSSAGWVATVNGEQGTAFVQRFVYEPERPYPEGSSVEFWTNGVGSFRAWGKENVMKDDPVENPYVFESEMLSPYARLEPGESYQWHYDWYVCRVGGSFPVIECTTVGITCERLTAEHQGGRSRLRGRFGVFYVGTVEASFLDAAGHACGTEVLASVSPLAPVLLSGNIPTPVEAVVVSVVLRDKTGKVRGELARAPIDP